VRIFARDDFRESMEPMENLFRFVIVRPATAVASDLALTLERKSKFQEELLAAVQQPRPRPAMKEIARRFADSSSMARAAADLHWGAGFIAMRAGLDAVTSITEIPSRIQQWFGTTPDKLVSDSQFRTDDERTADSIIAIKLLPAEQRAASLALADVLRHVSIIVRLVNGDSDLGAPGGLSRARKRPLALPPRLFPIPSAGPDVGGGAGPRPPTGDLDRAREAVYQLQATVDELMTLDLTALHGDGETKEVVPTDGADDAKRSGPAGAKAHLLAPLILRPAAAAALSKETQAVVAARRLDLAEVPLDRVITSVSGELAVASRRLAAIEAEAVRRNRVGLVGSTPVRIDALPYPATPAAGPGPAAVPTTHGTIRSVGVADLLVVKQALKRYEARDIAHVENILRGESKRREHHRTTTTEQLTVSEVERVREQERELESTERFEMSKASSETISQDASLTTGLTVTGSYGPTVDFEASVQGSLEEARERSVQLASSYSRDITDRSRTRVSETIRELRSLRVINTVEEKNEHTLDNTRGDGHVVGIYQWLEKVYEAQIFNYGLRAMFDFIVPEPAAFAIYAMQAGFADATQIESPRDFNITPAQITETNYHQFVRDWQATGVSPPPEPFVTVTKTFRGGPDDQDSNTRGMAVDTVELPLLDGYRALSATAVARSGHWSGDTDMTIKLTVGRRTHDYVSGGAAAWSTQLDGEVGSMGVALRSWRPSSFTVTVEVTCQRTVRAMDKWRYETYAALLQAYQQQRAAYEEKLKALRARAGVEIAGKNPALNREIERRELKKACLSILTAQHFDLFNAIDTGPDGLPQTDVDEIAVEGPYIRFFEQAFEWHNVTYVFYPYFWGRRATWVDRFQYDDPDPLFAAFLRAGAARVVVPVRPGFELVVDHFLATGEVWQGGEPPPVTSDTYVPIAEELAEQLGAPGEEQPQGEPWDVSVPTSLVLLRGDGSLPRWHKDEDGDWVPDGQ